MSLAVSVPYEIDLCKDAVRSAIDRYAGPSLSTEEEDIAEWTDLLTENAHSFRWDTDYSDIDAVADLPPEAADAVHCEMGPEKRTLPLFGPARRPG